MLLVYTWLKISKQYLKRALIVPKVCLICAHASFFPCFGTKMVPSLQHEIVRRHGVTLVYTSSVHQAK